MTRSIAHVEITRKGTPDSECCVLETIRIHLPDDPEYAVSSDDNPFIHSALSAEKNNKLAEKCCCLSYPEGLELTRAIEEDNLDWYFRVVRKLEKANTEGDAFSVFVYESAINHWRKR